MRRALLAAALLATDSGAPDARPSFTSMGTFHVPVAEVAGRHVGACSVYRVAGVPAHPEPLAMISCTWFEE